MSIRTFLPKSLYTAIQPGFTGIYSTVRCNSSIAESTIKTKLLTALNTYHLEVVSEPTNEGTETQMKLVVVTDKFHGLPMYKRYNLINDILKEELQSGSFKFSIVAQTPIQWHRVKAAKEFPLSDGSVSSGGGSDK